MDEATAREPNAGQAPLAFEPAVLTPPPPWTQAVVVPLASLGDRLMGLLVDALVVVGVFFFVGLLLAPAFGGSAEQGFSVEGGPALLILTVVGLVALLYFVLAEWAGGATLGKLVAATRVRTTGGGRVSFRAALVRNLLRVVDGFALYLVGAIAVLVTKRRQRLGDLAAGTIVVQREWPRPVRAGALVVAIAIASGGVVGGFLLRPAPPAAAGPRIASVILTDDQAAALHKTVFPPSTTAFYLLVTLADVPPNTELKAVWTAENVQGERPNLKIDEASVPGVGGGRNRGTFTLTRVNFSWPPGTYRADLYLGSVLAESVQFRVEPAAAPGAGGSPPPASGQFPTAAPGR